MTPCTPSFFVFGHFRADFPTANQFSLHLRAILITDPLFERSLLEQHSSRLTGEIVASCVAKSKMQSFAQSSAIDTPILRLDASVWASFGAFAFPNDLIKLCILSSSLRDRIKPSTRVLKLNWTSKHYIDLSTVLHESKQFPSVSHLHFESQDELKPHWVPVNWSLLPSHLTSLSFSFNNCIAFFLGGSNLIGDLLPSLTSLALIEHGTGGSKPPGFLVRLCGLPTSLLHLHLASNMHLQAVYSEISALPASLETLTLDMKTSLVDDQIVALNDKVRAPSFPRNLKTLSYGQYHPLAHLDMGALPRSLRSLHFACLGPMRSGSFESNSTSSTLEGSSLDLPLLTDVFLPDLCANLEAALTVFASPSIERLHLAKLQQVTDLQAAAPLFAKMVSYYYEGYNKQLLEAILEGAIPVPKLKCLQTQNAVTSSPPSLLMRSANRADAHQRYVATTSQGDTTGLMELYIAQSSTFHRFLDAPSGLIANLVNLHIPNIEIDTDHLDKLPDTLECFEAPFFNETLAHLFIRMNSDARFPKLKQVLVMAPISCESIEPIPSQVEKIVLQLLIPSTAHAEHLGRTIQAASLLQSLTLHFRRTSAGASDDLSEEATIRLINSMPLNLTSFVMMGLKSISKRWPLVFPTSITSLGFTSSSSKELPAKIPSAVVFPPSLRSLELPTGEGFTPDELPRHLSALIDGFRGSNQAYFASRKHPDPNLAGSVFLPPIP